MDGNSVRRRGLRILFRLIFSSAAFGDVWGNLRERSLPKDPPDRCRHLATKICEESLLVPVIDLLPLNSKFTLFDCTVKMDLGLLK